MSMVWIGVGTAVAGVGSAIIGADAQGDALDAQERAAQSDLELKKQMFDEQIAMGQPYREFGEQYLPMLGEAMTPIDRQAELGAYYQSPEYAMMNDQARNQQLASSEATGGLGSTSTGNALGAIAPQLGQNYLAMREGQQADLFNRLLSGVSIGLSGAGMQQQAASNYGTQAGNIMQNLGAAQGNAGMASANMWGNALGSVAGAAANYGMYQNMNGGAV